MFFSDTHERAYVDPLFKLIGNSPDFFDTRCALEDDDYNTFANTVAEECVFLRDRGAPDVTNRRRKTAIRLWELMGGNLGNYAFRQACADQQRVSDADRISSTPANLGATSESTTVNSSKATQTITYIFGQDVTTMSSQQLISAATRVQNEITALKATGLVSTKVDSMVAEHQASLAVIVAALDAS
jgi:hypothetical protein